jgi:sodium/bile acid cotransporter 7
LPIFFRSAKKKSLCRIVIGIICLFSLMIALPTAAKRELTDREKRDRVYAMYAQYKQSFPKVQDITPPEAKNLMQTERIQFVDTRRPEERAVSMLPGAISQAEFLKAPQRYTDATVIVYCTISYRSGLFAEDLSAKGITVYNLAGGLLAWVLEGGTVENATGETRQIHVYGDEWNYPPKGYTAHKFNFIQRLIR